VFEHREVLHERWELHVEWRGQLADGGWSDRQSLQDFAPSRVGQGVKHVVGGCGLNHSDTIQMLGLSGLTDGFYNGRTLL
jgi:hypothetical protein